MDLNTIMEFDHVVRVDGDGNVSDVDVPFFAPEVVVETDADGSILGEHEAEMLRSIRAQGWDLLTGFTGQYSYNGPIMHSSEYIGGGLEKHILANPGYYVTVVVAVDLDDPSPGWAVAYRPLTEED